MQEIRKEIDLINSELVKLINERTKLVEKIAKLKSDANQGYFDPLREEEMLREVIRNNAGPLPNELMKEIFANIFQVSLSYMSMNCNKSLLVNSKDSKFKSIREIFDIRDEEDVIIAGPCAIENTDYIDSVGSLLNSKGVKFLRGGAYKPRTSPYDFQGLKTKGLEILHEVGKKYNLYTVAEIVDTRDVDKALEYIDIIQIGARNMQNFELLKEVGQTGHPVLLKRGMSSTIQELIYAAEYVALQGNRKVILCERGIRTFENKTRNTLDISSIPILKQETNLSIIVDLSHSLGRKDIICSIAKAVMAAGADGIMVEVHPNPSMALSDSKQQLDFNEFEELLRVLR